MSPSWLSVVTVLIISHLSVSVHLDPRGPVTPPIEPFPGCAYSGDRWIPNSSTGQTLRPLEVRHAVCACTKHVASCICLHIIFQETLVHTAPACWVAVVHTHWEITPCENNTFTTFKCPQTHVSSLGHPPAVNSHSDFSHLQATVVQHTAEQYEGLGRRQVQN